jgi:hypothetical protein
MTRTTEALRHSTNFRTSCPDCGTFSFTSWL